MSSKQVIVVAWEMGSREKGGSVKSNEKKGKARLGLFFITQLKLKVTKMKKKIVGIYVALRISLLIF